MPEHNEHVVAIVSFEGAVKREVKRLREQLKHCPNLSQFELRIEANGRTEGGEVKLKYMLSQHGYSDNSSVEGDTLYAVQEEFLRRHGWVQQHSPKAIAYEKIPSDNTDPEEAA